MLTTAVSSWPVAQCLGAVAPELTQAEQLLDSKQEAGAADPTDQNGDLHIARQYARATCGRLIAGTISTAARGVVISCDRHAERPINNRNAEI